MLSLRHILLTAAAMGIVSMAGCGGNGEMPMLPTSPATPVTANAYILPNAISLGNFAFGDEPIVIYRGERLRWVNLDALTHSIVADSPGITDFSKTDELRPNGEQSFIMTKLGTTPIHCSIHPNMTGTVIVRER